MTDIVNEFYGRPGVRLISWMAAGLIAYSFLFAFIAIRLTPASWWVTAGQTQGVEDMRSKKGAAKTYTAQLEETEDRLLKHYERAITEVESPAVREILTAQLPKLRRCHDEMKRLKLSLAA